MSGRPQMSTMNGKRPSSLPQRHHPNDATSQHFDLIKYIYESWNSVSKELDSYHNQQHGNSSNYRNSALVTYYQEHEPNPQLKDFKQTKREDPRPISTDTENPHKKLKSNFEPFDLEAYWNQRGVQNISRNSNS